jgi:hypothetical protein
MLVALALVMGTFLWWLRRQSELFWISIRAGKLLVVRGRVPQGLAADFAPHLRSVRRGSVFVHKTSSGGRLTTSGIDEPTTQRLRNLLGILSPSQLLSALPVRNPTLGQRLGIGWLAWRRAPKAGFRERP